MKRLQLKTVFDPVRFVALMRADGNAIGDRVLLQLIHWLFIRLVQSQIAVLGMPLQLLNSQYVGLHTHLSTLFELLH